MIDLDTILERDNLNRAFKAVVANKGSAGVDGMEVGDLLAYLKAQGADLVKSINPNSREIARDFFNRAIFLQLIP